MTTQAAEALPEWRAITQREEIIDGKRVIFPVMNCAAFLMDDEDYFLFEDSTGQFWHTGSYSGTRYKIRSRL